MTEILKKIKFKKVIYPAILGVFFVGVIIIFIYSANFLVKSIDKSLSLDLQYAESRIIKIDFDKFSKVAGKLGIEIKQEAEIMNQESMIENQPIAATTAEEANITTTTTATTIPVLDKKAVKISVLNSTKTKGLAVELKNLLENDGFIVGLIGNYESIQEKTFVKIKESKKDYSSLVKESIAKEYQLADDQTLEESNIYDIIIIIGEK